MHLGKTFDGGNLRVLVVAPFTHQNGHFVTFPRDIACALATIGADVTLLHTRPFRIELDEFDTTIKHVCLLELLKGSPRWWREIWPRLANRPSNQCLAWMLWQLKSTEYDLILWTDFQAQANVWPLTIARLLGLYRFKSAFFEHHQPDEENTRCRLFQRIICPDRFRLIRLDMFVLSKALLEEWKVRIGSNRVHYIPHGVWPTPLTDYHRHQARLKLGISLDARVLLVFGVQAIKRKHIDTLAEALMSFEPKNSLLLLFIGANVTGETHPFSNFQHSHSKIEVRFEDGFVSEDRARMYFSASDAVWANYRNFPGASGVLLHAMGFGRLVIASNDGEIGSLCREHNLGQIVASTSPDDLHSLLQTFIAMPRERQLGWEQSIASTALQYSWPKVMRQMLSNLGFRSFDD